MAGEGILRKYVLLELCAVCLCLGLAQSARGDGLVWTDFGPNAIYSAQPPGSNVTTILSTGSNAVGVAVDSVNQQVYWTENLTTKIRRANINGTGIQDLWTGSIGSSAPEHIALDVPGGRMYWTDDVADRVRRANLDGSNVQDLVAPAEAGNPYGIALDLARGKMYWADFQGSRLRRANLDGSSIETVISGGAAPYTVALDPVSSQAYFTTFSGLDSIGSMTIERVNFDGTGRQTLVNGLGFPRGLALDLAGGSMYWTDDELNIIRRASLNGTQQQSLISSGLDHPSAIVFVPEPSVALLALCGLALCNFNRRR